jgi:uncharacterized protein with PIN domain
MLGHDVVYSVEFEDAELLELAKREERVLLTRDLELYKRAIAKGLDAYYVEGETEPDRLAEVAKRYSIALEIYMDKSHCPICNTKLAAAPKEHLQDELEKNTYTHYTSTTKNLPVSFAFPRRNQRGSAQQAIKNVQKTKSNQPLSCCPVEIP